MKRYLNRSLYLILAFGLFSCYPKVYYQVYDTEISENLQNDMSGLTYEDENVKILYNLWADGGNIGFSLYNKSDQMVYLKLEECFFVFNGEAHDYFKNRTFTNIIGTQTIEYKEKKVLGIPPSSLKNIEEFIINNSRYVHCDLLKYPRRDNESHIHFSRQKSPFVFSNWITYYTESSEELRHIKNEFYVSDITNYYYSDIVEYQYVTLCGNKSSKRVKVFKNISPDKFYKSYKQSYDSH